MSCYQEKREARISWLQDRAAAAEAQGNTLVSAGDEALARIPFGQPILIGHHSERGDRAYRGRAIAKIDKGMELTQKARELARRAEAAANNRMISADDPDAPDKLRERIEKLELTHRTMVAMNRVVHAKPKDEVTDEKVAAIVALGMSEGTARKCFEPDFCGRIGIPGYELSNRSVNIRRLRERLATVEANADTETTETEYADFTVREDADLNRVQILFPGKPDESARALLKANGFRWAPSEGAWQRQLNNAGRYAARCIAEKLEAPR